MNWRLKSACSIDISVSRVRNTETTVKVRLMPVFIENVCIGLSMLKERLIDSMDLVGSETIYTLRLKLTTHKSPTMIQFDNNMVVLVLDEIELDRWLQFTLRTVRDSVSEVDHIDLDAPVSKKNDETASIILYFPSSLPPVTADEARRRLGLQ